MGATGAVAKPDSFGANGEVSATSAEDSEQLFVAKVCSPSASGTPARPGYDRPVPSTRYRCEACGNLTRFDVVASRRTRAFHHYSIGGELTVEEEEVLDERVEQVTCRWCNASGDAIERIAIEESA
jgi:hypothetical protein